MDESSKAICSGCGHESPVPHPEVCPACGDRKWAQRHFITLCAGVGVQATGAAEKHSYRVNMPGVVILIATSLLGAALGFAVAGPLGSALGCVLSIVSGLVLPALREHIIEVRKF